MLIKSFIVVVFSLSYSGAWAASGLDGKSAYREPGISYRAYKAFAHVLSESQVSSVDRTPVDTAKAYGSANLPAATAWPSQEEMLERFKRFRDLRFLDDRSHPDFLRRSTWLYPDDGCFARAALAILNLDKWNYEIPNKVFVFGDLAVKTKNSPDGEVTWWYHVAPLVEVDGQKYVLDPAVEPEAPLLLKDWLARMSPDPATLEVAVCGSGSYTPYDACAKETDHVEDLAGQEQSQFLGAEWQRLKKLGRSPESELGDFPPWLYK